MSLEHTITRWWSFPRTWDARLLDGLRFEAVIPELLRVEVADILGVRVPELVDIEEDGELLVLARAWVWTTVGSFVSRTETTALSRSAQSSIDAFFCRCAKSKIWEIKIERVNF